MFVSTWEEFHTGTLYLGYINGPVEGVLIAVGILIVSAIKGMLSSPFLHFSFALMLFFLLGPGWWATPVSEALGNFPLVPSSFQVLDLVMLFLASAFFVAHLPLW
jgi:ethanolaminephosphotransferase